MLQPKWTQTAPQGCRREVPYMARQETDTQKARAGLVVRLASGMEFPLVTGPAGYKAITGDSRSDHAVRDDCSAGVIPTLPHAAGSGAHHRIPVAPALDQLGVPYEIVQSGS